MADSQAPSLLCSQERGPAPLSQALHRSWAGRWARPSPMAGGFKLIFHGQSFFPNAGCFPQTPIYKLLGKGGIRAVSLD